MQQLALHGVSFRYPQKSEQALRDVSFSVQAGEYIALVGANGSGKSTLARMIAGFMHPTEGRLDLEDDVLPGIVFQQPKEQIIAGVVERDTAFGPQNLSMSRGEIELRTIECLSVVGMADRAASRTFELSLGQTQRLAFSGILALFPDMLILDEVTAMLDPGARTELVKFISQWNARGHTIIHVTHDLDEALRAKRILALDEGRIIFDGPQTDFMSRPDLTQKIFAPINVRGREPPAEDSPVTLSVENISFSYPERPVLSGISFSLKKGTLTAITGPSGCGKSTLFECLAGLKECSGGIIRAVSRPALALQESDAALFEPCAADDVAFGPKNSGLSGKDLVARVKDSMEKAGLPYEAFADRATFHLSGGEKRKLSLAGIIALGSDIFIFDEPTSALDSESRNIVLGTLRGLADEGKTVLFSTHRPQEAMIADFHLDWSELSDGGSGRQFQNAEDDSLKKLEPFKNGAILKNIGRAANSFMAPAEIPKSPVSVLPSVVKFMLFLTLAVFSVCAQPFYLCAAAAGTSVLYALLARYPLRKPLYALWKLFPWILIFMILELTLFPPLDGDKIIWSWGTLFLTDRKILLLARAFLRSVSLIFCTGTFLFTTSERQIMDGLSAFLKPLTLIKIPAHYLVLVAGIFFRFVPLLLDELLGIIKTQLIRGALGKKKGLRKLGAMISLVVPLILQTFRKAQTLADALTARYFK